MVFIFFNLSNIFENVDQKVPKKGIFWQKIMFFDFFGQSFQKYCLIQKFEKKNVPRVVSKHDFQAILAFLTQNNFFSLSQKFWTKKSGFFCHFLKKSTFLVKFNIKNGFSNSIPFQKYYFYIHYSNSLKVTALNMFKKNLGSHPLKCTFTSSYRHRVNKVMPEFDAISMSGIFNHFDK